MLELKFKRLPCLLLAWLIIFSNHSFAKDNLPAAITKPIPLNDLQDFQHDPNPVQALIIQATSLSQKNLTYQYGSADPHNQGMDCSGTIYYLLNSMKIADVPRDANGMYQWVEKKGQLHRVTQMQLNSAEFAQLKPGDLLFWSGTYATSTKSSISHVMIYLGKNKQNKPLMFGSSDGRTYQGKKMWGVSVFDFNLPDPKSHAKFEGYSCIPNYTCHKSLTS